MNAARFRIGAALGVAAMLCGCLSPSSRLAQVADSVGFERDAAVGKGFTHILYRNADRIGTTLHVYIDGDGTPWAGAVPSEDPTPRHPVMLGLMALDSGPALYLGRPCYLGTVKSWPCEPRHWTRERYSADVVASLAAVVRREIVKGGYRHVAWFGHSGGGALAVLLASRFPQSSAVITVGANLDTQRWGRERRQDLSGSLNPASLPPLPQTILQHHYAGGADSIVPPAVAAAAAAHLGAALTVIDGFSHGCCWERIWSRLLDELRRSEKS